MSEEDRMRQAVRRGMTRQLELEQETAAPASRMAGAVPPELGPAPPDPEQITISPDFRPLAAQPAWRRDFPIDWPRDHYVARRDFAKFMVLTSLAFAVGQVWIGLRQLFGRRATGPVQKIATIAEVPVGSARLFHYPGPEDPCLLVRPQADVWLAYSQLCTHLSCAVVPRMNEGTFFCPCHEGLFEMKTGRPIAGPPRRPLPRVRLEVRGSEIYATGMDWRTV